MSKNKIPAASTSAKKPVKSVRSQLMAMVEKTTSIEVEGIDGPICFRGLSTSAALRLRDFDPKDKDAERTIISVISDLAYVDGKKLFDSELKFGDLPIEITVQIMAKFGELALGTSAPPLVRSGSPSTA